MACVLYVPMDGGRLLKVFPSSFPEGSGSFPDVFLLAVYMIALVTVYDATFVVLGVLVFRLHEYLFDDGVALEVNLYTILTTYLFDTFGYSFCIGYDYLSYCGLVTTSGCVGTVVLTVVVCWTVVVVPCLCNCDWIIVVAWIS